MIHFIFRKIVADPIINDNENVYINKDLKNNDYKEKHYHGKEFYYYYYEGLIDEEPELIVPEALNMMDDNMVKRNADNEDYEQEDEL